MAQMTNATFLIRLLCVVKDGGVSCSSGLGLGPE